MPASRRSWRSSSRRSSKPSPSSSRSTTRGAGLTEQAIVYWEKAGERAIQRSANAEAIERLSKALELLATVPETPERMRRELALQTRLGPAVIAVKGYAAPDVETVYSRARELCARVADCPQLLFSTLRGLWLFHHA